MTAPSRDVPWWELAHCKGLPSVVMHPPSRKHDQIEAAKRVCSGCPGKAGCLEEALDLEDVDGVRGGLSGEERAQILADRLPLGVCPECRRDDLRQTDGRLGRHWAPGTSPNQHHRPCRGSGVEV